MFLHHATPSYGATNLVARDSFAVRKPTRTWSWPFTSVYDWDLLFVRHAFWSACTGDLSLKWNVAMVRPLAKMPLTWCLSCGSRCLLCRSTFRFHVPKSSHPTEWLVIRMFNKKRHTHIRKNVLRPVAAQISGPYVFGSVILIQSLHGHISGYWRWQEIKILPRFSRIRCCYDGIWGLVLGYNETTSLYFI